jgi:ATP-dependent DNA helicase DinG
MLDAAAPTRLFSSLPEGVQIERVGLVEAIEAIRFFLKPVDALPFAEPSTDR